MIGIYKITINGKDYIGSSFNIERRKIQHKSNLIRQRHDNPHLQNAYNKYKEFNFTVIEVFEDISDKDLRLKEAYWKKECGYYNIQEPETHFEVKPVYQFNESGTLIKQYKSVKEAAEVVGCSESHIMHAAQENENLTRSACGYLWRYTDTIEISADKRWTAIHVYNIEGYYIKTYNSVAECVKNMFPKYHSSKEGVLNVCNNVCASYKGYRFSKDKVSRLDNTLLLNIKKGFPVVQITKDGKTKIKTWNTAAEAARYFNICSSSITEACKNNTVSRGFRWTRLGTKLSELLENPEDVKTETESETINGIV